MAISVSQPACMQDLQYSYEANEHAQQLLSEPAISSYPGNFSLSQGVIRFIGKFWLGHSKEIQNKVIQDLHSNPIGGHPKALVTFTRIKKYFSWPYMKSHVQKFVAACTICQRAKTERVPYPGLL